MSFPDLYIDFLMAAPRGSTMYVGVMNSLYTKKNVNNKLCPRMWFRLFKSYYEDPEVHLDLKSKHVL